MPAKRKLSDTNIESRAVPPALPPSVEEAYRRKCVQLKSRTNEIEEANDAARLRLARAKRQVEKLRIERAFLLEQLAKRTSTNVEDSDGSPSPPPTVCTQRQETTLPNPPAPASLSPLAVAIYYPPAHQTRFSSSCGDNHTSTHLPVLILVPDLGTPPVPSQYHQPF